MPNLPVPHPMSPAAIPLSGTPHQLHDVTPVAPPPPVAAAAPAAHPEPSGYGHLAGALTGGALGYMLGPDDEKGQSAMLGAAGGLGMAHLAHGGVQAARSAFGMGGGGGHPAPHPQAIPAAAPAPAHPDINQPGPGAALSAVMSKKNKTPQAPEPERVPPIIPGNPHGGGETPPNVIFPGKHLERTESGQPRQELPAPPPKPQSAEPAAPPKPKAQEPAAPPKPAASTKRPLGKPGQEIPANIKAPAEKPNSLQHQVNSEATYAAKGEPTPLQSSLAASATGQPQPAAPVHEEEEEDAPRTFADYGRRAIRQGQQFRQKASSEMSTGYSSNIGPFSVSHGVSHKDERLDGMHKWVPREVLEQVFQDVDKGLDDKAIIDAAGDQGNLMSPLIGGGLGATLAGMAFPKSGVVGPLLGGALGASGGAALHNATRGTRTHDTSEALKGVHLENERLKNRHQTSSASTPLTVSGGVLDS